MELSNSEKSDDILNNDDLQKKVNKINEKASTQKGFPITPINDNNNSDNDNDNSSESLSESFELIRNKKSNYDVNSASTIEDAYFELNNIIGGNLTNNAKNLLNQQVQLAETMKGMSPLIEKMATLINNLY